MNANLVRARALTLRQSVRHNAKARGIGFELTSQEAFELLMASKGRCALSGINFDDTWSGTSSRRPFAPSFDRIDANKPYTKANCRVVCVAVNYGLGDWGEEVLKLVALGICEKNGWSAKPAARARPRGVVARRHADGVRYEALITWNGKRWFLGTFSTPELAGKAYVAALDGIRSGHTVHRYLQHGTRQVGVPRKGCHIQTTAIDTISL